MKKLLPLLLVLICTALLAGCQLPFEIPGLVPSPTPGGTGNNNSAYNDPTHQTGEFRVIFRLGAGGTVVHRYDAGEMPDPPAVESYEKGGYTMEFNGWDKTPVPVTEDAVYVATYRQSIKPYEITFVYGANGQHSTVVMTEVGKIPKFDTPRDDGAYRFVCWDRTITIAAENTTYTAIYTKMIDPQEMKRAYDASLFDYQIHNWGDMMQACPIYMLAYHEHEDPKDGFVRDRLIAQLDALCGSGTAPDFDAWCNWSFPIITATVALAKDTPTVWNKLSFTQKAKLDTMMLAFSYLASVATSDYNTYHTGPGLRGNYYKTWNPNYRLANIPNIVFTTYYFGNGDINAGADYVNDRITSFNDSEYYAMLKKFESYGWDDAYKCWTTEEKEPGSGDAYKMLVTGGKVVHNTNDQKGLTNSGEGSLGVNNGGKDYRYTGYLQIPYTLYDASLIIEDLMYYNYGAGAVKNEHYYGTNPDGTPQKVAGIADGTSSPYLGQMGMMLELGTPGGNRSSTGYCSDDFTMIVPILTATAALPLYETVNGRRVAKTDAFGVPEKLYDYTKNAELWQMIQVGNEDFLYKYVHGYNSYAEGSYGINFSTNSEAKNAGGGYYTIKNLWRSVMKPLGDVPIFETLEGKN